MKIKLAYYKVNMDKLILNISIIKRHLTFMDKLFIEVDPEMFRGVGWLREFFQP